jgi:hypothetical protein
VTVQYQAAQIAGDLNVVIVGWSDSNARVNSLTDSNGNLYQLAVGPTVVPGALSQAVYYAVGIKAANAGANVVTASFTAPAQFPDVRILEYSGIDAVNPVDVTAARASGNSFSSSLPSYTGTVITGYAPDLLVGANTVAGLTTGPGANFTQRLLTENGNIAEDRVLTCIRAQRS